METWSVKCSWLFFSPKKTKSDSNCDHCRRLLYMNPFQWHEQATLITMWCPSPPRSLLEITWWNIDKSEKITKCKWIFNLALLHREICGSDQMLAVWSKTGSNQPVLSVKAARSRGNHFVVNSQSSTTKKCGKISIRKRVTSSVMGCSLFQTPLIHNRSRQTVYPPLFPPPPPSLDQFKTLMTK